MIRYENECCGCATESYPCQGEFCPNRKVKKFYCDCCGEEQEYLREVDGEELCDTCTLDKFTILS